MKYYCKSCGTKYEFDEKMGFDPDDMCPICGNDDPDYDLIPIPDWETLEQWEKRTGKFFPDDGIVFVLENDSDAPYWNMYEYGDFYEAAGRAIVNEIIVIADPPIIPPDNWRPE